MLMISAKLADDRVVIPESSCKMKELLSCSTFSAWSVSTFRSKWQAWQRCPRWASICASGLTKAGICQAVCVVLRSMHAYLQDRQHVRLHSVAAFHACVSAAPRKSRVGASDIRAALCRRVGLQSTCAGEGPHEVWRAF